MEDMMKQLLDLTTDKTSAQILQEFTDLQRLVWPLAANNYKGLDQVEEKSLQFGEFEIKIQFNPERMRSSSAKVDKASIAERPCFLCSANRPSEQEAIAYGARYLILVNPFPVFRNHFTISSNKHTDQRFLPNVSDLFDLARAMEEYTVFYNGPECGASAPDHLHFQAGESIFLPISREFELLKADSEKLLFSGKNTQVWAFHNYLRKMISVETSSVIEGLSVVKTFYQYFAAIQTEKAEPMMNALCCFSGKKWIVHLFPRKAHRPWQFFAMGKEQILIGPGSVDFGGVFITPRREDFDKMTKVDVVDILDQVCLNTDDFQKLTGQIKDDLENSKFAL
jgi:ATP adenylyltransferase/5',5'''-P-1,P-4-tetraphosphate phosphorylase II